MNDDTIQCAAFWILIISIAAPALFILVALIYRQITKKIKEGREDKSYTYSSDYIYRPWPVKLHAALIVLAALSWLWSPWLATGLVKVYRANWNAVNYVNRPDTVTPVPGKTYRADAAPAEVP